jgi:Tol biopolymer transport system component
MAYPHGTPKKITSIKNIGGLSWIPNGKEMIVSENGKLLRVSMDDGTKQELVVTAGMYASQPSVSQVGNIMAFTRNTIRYPDLFRLNIGNSKKKDLQPERIISSSMVEIHGKISPDGKRVAFVSNRTGSDQIWISDIDGANAIPITPVSDTDPPHPSWSPDGLFLVYEDAVAGIDIISSSGGSPVNISKMNNYLPRFSADGKSIYFCSNNNRADNQIWKVSKDGSNAVQITKNGGEAVYESQDGKWLYYSRFWTQGKEGLFKIPVEGGEEQLVINKPVYRDAWVLRKNGIYYKNLNGEKSELLLFEFANGKTKKIADFNNKTTDVYFDISPKEDWILYAQREETESDIMLIENFR